MSLDMDTEDFEPTAHNHKAHVWLWTGVSIFSLAIFVIWVFNTKTFIESTSRTNDSSTDLLKQGKDDFAQTIELIQKSDNSQKLLDDEQNKTQTPEKNTTSTESTDTLSKIKQNILLLLTSSKPEGATTTTADRSVSTTNQ